MKDGPTKLEFPFFDEDGVVTIRSSGFKIEGEPTGMKGDACGSPPQRAELGNEGRLAR
jgi:hypothetical protein